MRLGKSKSKNSLSLYVLESIYKGGKKNTTRIVEKLGTSEEIKQKYQVEDPVKWAQAYIRDLNRQEEERTREIMVKLSPVTLIEKDVQQDGNTNEQITLRPLEKKIFEDFRASSNTQCRLFSIRQCPLA